MLKKGQTVFYNPGGGSDAVRARIGLRCADGSYDFTALFWVDPNGCDIGPYLGFEWLGVPAAMLRIEH